MAAAGAVGCSADGGLAGVRWSPGEPCLPRARGYGNIGMVECPQQEARPVPDEQVVAACGAVQPGAQARVVQGPGERAVALILAAVLTPDSRDDQVLQGVPELGPILACGRGEPA